MRPLPLLWLCFALGMPGAPLRAAEAEPHPGAKTICLTPAETREEIKARKLAEPFAALKSAQAQFKGEPLSAKLCRAGEGYVYVIALLRHDGRYVHVVMNAETGKWMDLRRNREPTPKPEGSKP